MVRRNGENGERESRALTRRNDTSLTPWSSRESVYPMDIFRRYTQEMDRVFDRMFGNWGFSSFGGLQWPAIEMLDRDNKLVIRAELPGMKREDVRVKMQGDVLVLEGERRDESEQTRQGLHRSEWSYGRFSREIPLTADVDSTQINARMQDGVLEITLPYKEERQAREIQIEGGHSRETSERAGSRR